MEKSNEVRAVTVNDKADAFDRIAAAYLRIPAGDPPAEEVQARRDDVLAIVGREVQQLHPSYRA